MTGWIDLTKPMRADLAIYAQEGYRDAPFRVTPWSEVAGPGFATQRVEMATQTGTHVDAPSHFIAGAASLEQRAASAFVGRYAFGDARALAAGGPWPDRAGADILFLQASDPAPLPAAVFAGLIALGCPVWVMAGAVRVVGQGAFFPHREIARAGIWLVEDLDEGPAAAIDRPGEIIALPLRLIGTSGAPARVLIRPDP